MLRMTVGILAFGSLLDDPGAELQACIVRRIETKAVLMVRRDFLIMWTARRSSGGCRQFAREAVGVTVGATLDEQPVRIGEVALIRVLVT